MKQQLRFLMLALLCAVTNFAWGDRWVEVTDLTSLNANGNDIIVIVDKTSGRAMSNNNGTTSAPSAVQVTLSGDKSEITSTVDENLMWRFLRNEDNFQFQKYATSANSNYLYTFNNNNGLRVGGGNDNKFIIQDDFLYNIGQQRYIGVYNNQDWRSYTSINNNIQNTQIAFYKKTADTNTVATPTFTPADGTTFEDEQEISISCATTGATIYYTTDGGEPTTSSTSYNAPFTITETTTVKAIAVKSGMTNSAVASATYTKSEPSPVGGLLYEGFSKYDSDGDGTNEINISNVNLDYSKWDTFSKLYLGGTSNAAANGGCGKLGTGSAIGSMKTKNITLTGNAILTFQLKKYSSDTGKLKVTVTGATFDNGETSKEITPGASWTENTLNIINATGTITLQFATTTKRAYIDEIRLEAAGEIVAAPTITPNGSTFVNSQEVTITAAEGCAIYYTTDGMTTPTTASTLYSGPFTINATTTVKAIAVKGDLTSTVSQATFTKIAALAAPTFEPATGATIAVGTAIKISPDANSTVNGLKYKVNNGNEQVKNTNNYNMVTITENMVDDNEQVTIEAWSIYTYDQDQDPIEGTHATAIFNVVNPVVTFETPATVFANSIDVELSASPEGAKIYYSLDGTPTTSSTEYTGAITLTETTTIKAIAVVSGVSGAVASATYTKGEAAQSTSGIRWTRINSTSDLDAVATRGDKVIITNKVINSEGVNNDKYAMPSSGETGVVITIDDMGTGQYVSLSDESAVAIFKVEKSGSYYRFKVDGTSNYLCANTSNTITPKAIDESLIEDYNATISITDGKEDGFSFTESKKDYKYIRYNPPSTNLFRIYKGTSGTQGVSLYSKSDVTINAIDLKEGIENSTTISDNENELVTVNLYRSLSANMWNAICLPFSMTTTQMESLFGKGYELQQFDNIGNENGGTQLNFASVTGDSEAGVPYIVKPTQSVEKNAVVVISDVNITNTNPTVVEKGGYTFQGIYNPTRLDNIKDNPEQVLFIGANNKFYWPNTSTPMKAFRAYFTVPSDATTTAMSLSTDEGGIITSIALPEVNGLYINGGNDRVYSISGQFIGTKTEGLAKGIYIVNGRKFIVK